MVLLRNEKYDKTRIEEELVVGGTITHLDIGRHAAEGWSDNLYTGKIPCFVTEMPRRGLKAMKQNIKYVFCIHGASPNPRRVE